MPIPPCIIADVIIATATRACRNRLYYSPATPPQTPQAMNQIADIIRAGAAVSYHHVLSENATLLGVHTQWMDPNSELEGRSTDGPQGGSGTGDMLGEEVCLVIQRRTGKRGRENRGRIFISGLDESVNVDGKVAPAQWVNVQSIASNLKAVLNGAIAGVGNLTPKHWDRKNNTLETVTDCRGMDVLMSRRDRRQHLTPRPVGF